MTKAEQTIPKSIGRIFLIITYIIKAAKILFLSIYPFSKITASKMKIFRCKKCIITNKIVFLPFKTKNEKK